MAAHSFSLGPFLGGSASASFDGNQVRLFCAAESCAAQVVASGEGAVLGVEESGETNGPPTTTKEIFAETPGIVTLTTIPWGSKEEGDGHATLWLRNGTGWQIDLHLLTEPSGGHNIRLFGTAVPATINECVPVMGSGLCPVLNFT
jgi:hypothetical protein